jgi:quercetin dioxygenase-like cupin family protein
LAKRITQPTIIQAVGNKPKEIKEFFGRVNSKTEEISIAKMVSPSGWVEPGQTPEFDEYTVVLKGTLHVKLKKETIFVNEGEAIWLWWKSLMPYQYSG